MVARFIRFAENVIELLDGGNILFIYFLMVISGVAKFDIINNGE